MKNMKKSLVLALAGVSLLSLGITNLSNTNDKQITYVNAMANANKKVSTECSSIKDAVTKLAQSHNYTIHVETQTGPILVKNNMYYTENAFYDDYLGDEYGYVKCDEGVYRFDRYNRKFTPSSLLKDNSGELYTSVWDNGFFYGFSSLDLSEFEAADGLTFTCTKKKNKLAFMKIFSIPQTSYQDVDAITLTLGESKNINTLSFSVSLSKGKDKHDCTIQNFESTRIDYLEKQLANGKSYFKPEGVLAHVQDLFSNMNYTHFMYEDESSNINEPYGWEKFNENYYISGFTDEYLKGNPNAILSCSGMVGFKDYVVSPFKTMNGSYYTFCTKDSFSIISSMAYNENSYVPDVYVYPTYLKAFTDSQYFDVAGDENTYYTNKLSVINDFCDNFQLWETIQSLGVVIEGLYINYNENGYQGKETVTFSIEYSQYGYSFTSDFVFSDFNETKEEALEQDRVVKYLKATYGGCIYWIDINSEIESNNGVAYKQIAVSSDVNWLLDDSIKAKYSTRSQTTIYVNAGDEINFKVYDANKDPEAEDTISSSSKAYAKTTKLDVKANRNDNDLYYFDVVTNSYKFKVSGKVIFDLYVKANGEVVFDATLDD